MSASERMDRELASAAVRKRQMGETPSSREMAALRRFEKTKEEDQRWQHYKTIPQKHWREMSGRQTKILQEQSQRYGIPFDGRVIELPRVVRALHDFLAKNARRLAEDPDMTGSGDSAALERFRMAKAETAETELAREQGKLLMAEDVRSEWEQIGLRIRNDFRNATTSILPIALTLGMPMQASAEFQEKTNAIIEGILRVLSDAGRKQADEAEEAA